MYVDDAPLKTYTDRYDAWYDTPKGRALLASEVACLKPLLQRFPRPYLEVGVGTGRFAQALGIGYGVDPSVRALDKAVQRGVKALLKETGLCVTSFRSTLFQPPGLKVYREEEPVDGYVSGAGFVAIAAVKAG